MRELLAQLSTHEEAALGKIGFGVDDPLEPGHLQRLVHLELIMWSDSGWKLTDVGRQRFDQLVQTDGSSKSAAQS